MKLIIQIPCYNESQTLKVSLDALPKHIDGIDTIEYLVINDGSKDNTIEIAREWGVNYIVNFKQNMGLARGFMAGLDAYIRNGADIIVNTDADNQYCADDIEKLVRPILENKYDVVIGERPIDEIAHFSLLKKKLHEYTYTLETIIQAGRDKIAMTSVPIRTNDELRESRLFKSIPVYVRRSGETIIRSFVMYQPLKFFIIIGLIPFMGGSIIGIRFLFYYFQGMGNGHVQSLILAAVLLMLGWQTIMVGFQADIIAANRKLLQDIQYRVKKLEMRRGSITK